jgi:hypothetical protein
MQIKFLRTLLISAFLSSLLSASAYGMMTESVDEGGKGRQQRLRSWCIGQNAAHTLARKAIELCDPILVGWVPQLRVEADHLRALLGMRVNSLPVAGYEGLSISQRIGDFGMAGYVGEKYNGEDCDAVFSRIYAALDAADLDPNGSCRAVIDSMNLPGVLRDLRDRLNVLESLRAEDDEINQRDPSYRDLYATRK